VPDVAYVAKEHLPTDLADLFETFRRAPDLAVEVLSPDQPAGPFAAKIRFCLRHGVRLLWVVDPEGGTVRVFTPDDDERLLVPGDTLDGGDVLPGFSLPVADIFAQLEL
jgi:Uma2 family endonuclease